MTSLLGNTCCVSGGVNRKGSGGPRRKGQKREDLPQEFVTSIGPGGFEPPFSDPKAGVPLPSSPGRSGRGANRSGRRARPGAMLGEEPSASACCHHRPRNKG